MGYDAACVDTMGMIMKSWITPHLFRVQLSEGNGEGWVRFVMGKCVYV